MDPLASILLIVGMFFIFFLVGTITSFSSMSRIKSLENELLELKRRFEQLVNYLQAKETGEAGKAVAREIPENKSEPLANTGKPSELKTESKIETKIIESEERAETPDQPIASEISEDSGEESETDDLWAQKTPEHAIPKKEKSELAAKIEKSLLENWTGILGSVIIVTGLSFLGVFVAMNMNPFVRFLLLVGVSLALAALSFALRKSVRWQKLAIWVRSIAAATFLFACVGGGGIDGLKWVENQFAGLALLSFGIIVNIALAYAGKNHIVASIHVVLSLLTLFIAPQNEIIFVIASVICLSGVVLTYKEKWEFHLLLTIVAFAGYFIFYYIARFDELTFFMRIEGVMGILIVHLTALLVHYRKIYSESAFKPAPLIAHLANWLLFGLGIYLYTPDVYWISVPLVAAGIGAFFLARSAKKIGIRWLYLLDTLMSQAIVYLGILALVKWDVSPFPIAVLFYFSVLAFLAITILEKESLLSRIGSILLVPALCTVAVVAFATFDSGDTGSLIERAISIFVCAAALSVFHAYALGASGKPVDEAGSGSHRKRFAGFHVPAQGIYVSMLLVVVYILLAAHESIPWYIGPDYFLIVPVLALAVVRKKIQSDWLGIGLLIVLLFSNCTGWIALSTNQDAEIYEKLIAIVPCFAMNLIAILLSYIKRKDNFVMWPGIYLLFAHAAVSVYFVLSPVSDLIPGVAWLILSVLALESARIIRRRLGDAIVVKGSPDRFILNAGYLLILAFLIIHIAVDLGSEKYILIFRARLLVGIFALLVFVYWGLAKKPETGKIYKSWISFHPLFPELILAFLALTFAIEVKQIYLPVCWIGLAIACFAGGLFFKELSRLRFYSVFLFWASAIHVGFVTSPAVTPSLRFFDSAWIFGVAAIFLELCYIVLFHKNNGLDNIDFPHPIAKLSDTTSRMNKRHNLWIYYPLFACIAFFLVWSFDASILTLLLSAEAFAIFGVSIILRENHFRYLSLLGLGICLVRLVFFDLAESNTIVRAVVFIGVGSLMLLMNALYNRFKGRYEK